MYIESVELKNFRNYNRLSISFDRETNIFFGDNAQGKTNILEAIYVCGTTKSHRSACDSELIRFGEDEAHIRMHVSKDGVPHKIDMHLKKNKAKGAAIDGMPIRKASELFGLIKLVLFSPEDLNIIKSGPRERRRFMDSQLCQLDRLYFSRLSDYNKILMQRNKLLKDLAFQPSLEPTLDVWDEQLLRYGIPIIRQREQFIGELNETVREIHSQLTCGKEEIRLFYEPDSGPDYFSERLKQNREKDLKYRTSSEGPHRDDFRVEINQVDIRHFGSQGQQRSAALSLKLSEIYLIRQKTGEMPVLLLDDVLSELDSSRQKMLLQNMNHVKTFISCTGVDELVGNHFPMNRVFYVENGSAEIFRRERDLRGENPDETKQIDSSNVETGQAETGGRNER